MNPAGLPSGSFGFLATNMILREPRWSAGFAKRQIRPTSDIEGGVLSVAKSRKIRRTSLRDLVYLNMLVAIGEECQNFDFAHQVMARAPFSVFWIEWTF